MKSNNDLTVGSPITRWRSIQECAAYIYRHRRWPAGVVIFLLLLVFLIPSAGSAIEQVHKTHGWLIEVATLVVTCIVVWITDGAQWRESLPKRLSVRFYYDDKVVMECNFAHLSDAGDIRPLGMQIGSQMVDDQQLKFSAPLVRMEAVQTVENPVDEESDEFPLIRHYQASYYLTVLPKAIDLDRISDSLLRWRSPFRQPEYEPRV